MSNSNISNHYYDVIILGAGAAGLMCAIEAGKRGRKVLVIDHSNKAGKKILMSGGGRCNFTNYDIQTDRFTAHNLHFVKSALSRYTQYDFISLVEKHNIPFHEKKLGQLFCDDKSKDILLMLLKECETVDVEILLNCSTTKIEKQDHFIIKTNKSKLECESLVVATGGLSIPTLGASPFGYKIAEQFGIKVWPTRAGLVPFTLDVKDKARFSELSGVSVPSIVQCNDVSFEEDLLFTHRGLSGPAILQISSFWKEGAEVEINLLPNMDFETELQAARKDRPDILLKNRLSSLLPKSVVSIFLDDKTAEIKLKQLEHQQISEVMSTFQAWKIKPGGTEGYRTAEVTLGGVDCDAISSKTMQALNAPGLYFIGEVLDVHGWLGGYNFQWAWSSGWAAGQAV